MKIFKTRTVQTPTRGTSTSAGIDFYVPMDFERKVLEWGDDVLIPSGIKANVPEGYALIAMNKSGVAVKKGLLIGACVVDEDYQGEIHIHVINTKRKFCTIESGEKLVQFLLLPIFYDTVEEVSSEDELYNGEMTERAAGGFGSTGV